MSALENIPNKELAEEIEAINAIYEPDTITVTHTGLGKSNATTTPAGTLDLGHSSESSDDGARTTVTLQIPEQPHLSFRLGFPATYPETCPEVLGTASTAARGEGKIAVDVLEGIIQRTWQPGAVCLFDVISEAVEIFPELNIGGTKESASAEATHHADETQSSHHATSSEGTKTKPTMELLMSLSLQDKHGHELPPDWVLSDVITEKKSVFLARAVRVTSLTQAQAFLDHLTVTDKKVAAATHNISAWRIKQSKEGDFHASNGNTESDASEKVIQDYDDDGETAAGGRLLHVMQLMDVWNVLVVVSRWYGGIQLGPARFKLINDVGRDALVKGGFNREENTRPSDKGKKKGKK
ncbi:hypothetical protein PDE_09440 [Penicillium oxalicum 114-2]|uniref:RWD domain-containing protein n=1 Tax=Penicillium oxalicum (strain 114-2 / CGMCC 5302) TaxID=933388 RepID=S8A051_PENO1|nr:hypothetical protein PDE_09440 [Penicillium oxalicum 114-2]